MLRPSILIGLALLTTSASGQVAVRIGPCPNETSALLFNDSAFAPGPIDPADPAFAAAGFASITPIGDWNDLATTLGSVPVANAQCLTATATGLSIVGAADTVAAPTYTAGYDIVLTNPVDEFGFSQGQAQTRTYFRVELFSGSTSLGEKTATFQVNVFDEDRVYVRAGAPFDRVRLIYTDFLDAVPLNGLFLGSGPPVEPLLPDSAVETTYTGHLGGGGFGTFLFNLDANVPLEIRRFRSHFLAAFGTQIDVDVFTTPGPYEQVIFEPDAWTLAGTSQTNTVSRGPLGPSFVALREPIRLPSGTTGIRIVVNTGGHIYSYADGFSDVESSANGAFQIRMGTSVASGPINFAISGRVWGGRLRALSADVGEPYCTPAVANSTGNPAELHAFGSASIAENNLRLIADKLPTGAFGFFLASQTQDLVPMAGGSVGTLCVGGSIGRYVGPGQVQTADVNGVLTLPIDLTALPQPTGSVMGIPGDVWNFQTWNRDAVGGVAGSNFSSALSVMLEP